MQSTASDERNGNEEDRHAQKTHDCTEFFVKLNFHRIHFIRILSSHTFI